MLHFYNNYIIVVFNQHFLITRSFYISKGTIVVFTPLLITNQYATAVLIEITNIFVLESIKVSSRNSISSSLNLLIILIQKNIYFYNITILLVLFSYRFLIARAFYFLGIPLSSIPVVYNYNNFYGLCLRLQRVQELETLELLQRVEREALLQLYNLFIKIRFYNLDAILLRFLFFDIALFLVRYYYATLTPSVYLFFYRGSILIL